MVGHRFAQAAVERGLTETHDVLVHRRGAARGVRPGRAHQLVRPRRAVREALSLLPGGEYDDPRVRLVIDSVVTEIDRAGADGHGRVAAARVS